MSPKKEKVQKTLLQKDDIKCHELIINFKKSIELWFLSSETDDDGITFKEIQNACLEIILHGLYTSHKPQSNNNTNVINESSSPPSSTYTESYSDPDLYSANKIIDDFEWVLNAVNIRNNSKLPKSHVSTPPSPYSSLQTSSEHNQKPLSRQTSQTKETQLKQWLRQNLSQTTLCVFLQYLVSEKDLLEEHYTRDALLRQEKYVDALFIGLSALETHQYGLLTQMEALLKKGGTKESQHKRSNSQPNVIVPVKRIPGNSEHFKAPLSPPRRSAVLLAIRKTNSLPEFKTSSHAKDVTDSRPRCKTIAGMKRKYTQPQNIPQTPMQVVDDTCRYEPARMFPTLSGSAPCDDDQRPSTSQNSTSNRNKSPTSTFHLSLTASTTTSASMSNSVSSSNSNITARRIQLINTDDIKIWTDHTWELKNKHQTNTTRSTPTQAIPTPHQFSSFKTSKSLSPLNSFFSSLFSTPPSYTSWYTDHSSREENQLPETAIDSINSENHGHVKNIPPTPVQTNPVSMSSTVFDKFLPIYGQKLRSRNSQNLFDDVNTALDYSTPVSLNTSTTTHKGGPSSPSNSKATAKNCESLTKFLQMSHLSRNNTELEKENAHFRISEAIISAIEHIKWNKQAPQRDKLSREATPMATDCLYSSEYKQATSTNPNITDDFVEGEEHVPYAEEVCSELLSAEVVGLSLISKFDEKHLPKVSELKWLVSDEDTPQKLLPIPDLTSSANPDEHVLHSVTRGTKYWAPPRQQIIFTDHPAPNRKELLRKQNFRCAGCGMRVSPMYHQSFRYCTYLGKYHCTGCHRNQISATPAKILQSWDFKCYPVSVFAYRLLEQMSSYPLFYVPDLNPALYFRSKSLLSARKKRMQLKFVKDFIRTCRFALREQMYFESVPDYITSDIDNWSMSDFIDARSNCLHRSIDELIIKCENHIFNCVLCTARGFLCEYCNVDGVIYPWDSRVERCDRCGSCFHRNCWKSMSELCCRCQRIDKRHEDDDGIHDV